MGRNGSHKTKPTRKGEGKETTENSTKVGLL